MKSEVFDLPKQPFWFKVTGMLAQNWAMVIEQKLDFFSEAKIYFFDDHGDVFDTLAYPNAAQAEHALGFNGFTPLDDVPGFRAIAGEPKFPLTRSEWNMGPGAVYSSGRYWNQPPDIANITRRRHVTPSGLQRFISAQQKVIDIALKELNIGRKSTHWMWFIFPQLFGLGHSTKARKYGIVNLEEAQKYLDHPLLGSRLRECFQQVILNSDKTANAIFGHIDAMKFRSCATLFCQVDRSEQSEFALALHSFYEGKTDQKTLELLYR